MTVDCKDNEGRDAMALIDWLAKQPEARLDKAGDPRVGMHGASYAGGIEFVTAAIDKRVDAIAPAIAWHSLLTSLYREDTAKTGWGSALYAAGVPAANRAGRRARPAHQLRLRLRPGDRPASAPRTARGSTRAGPGAALLDQVRVPTLILQGTADTLFTPSEALRNAEILRRTACRTR